MDFLMAIMKQTDTFKVGSYCTSILEDNFLFYSLFFDQKSQTNCEIVKRFVISSNKN